MKLKVIGVLTALGLGGLAWAQDEEPMAEERTLDGEVLAVAENIVYLEGDDGEVVPMKVTEVTVLEGESISGTERNKKLKQEIQTGDTVETTFTRHRDKSGKMENRATSIEKQ